MTRLDQMRAAQHEKDKKAKLAAQYEAIRNYQTECDRRDMQKMLDQALRMTCELHLLKKSSRRR